MPKMTQQELDEYVVRFYQSKKKSCAERGIAFNLSLASLRNLLRAQKCYYTGIVLTKPQNQPRQTDISLDRIDSSKPYEKGNVVACCVWANHLKNFVESPARNSGLPVDYKSAKKVFDKTLKRVGKK